MTITMRDVAPLYDIAQRVTIDRVCVEDPAFGAFSFAVRDFHARLGDDADDPYWQPVVARLKRVRWALATVPLPFKHPAFSLQESAAFVEKLVRRCRQVFPTHASVAADVAAQLADLSGREDDPLGNAIAALCERQASVALILHDGRHAVEVEEHLARKAVKATVLVPVRLATTLVYDHVIVVGPSSWFPQSVFSAPKAPRIHLVQFDWLADPLLTTAVFSSSSGQARLGATLSLPAYNGRPLHGDVLNPTELLPVTDWAAISSRTGARAEDVGHQDMVPAYLLLLASQQAIYVEADDGSRAYVAELGATRDLHQVPTRSITAGAYFVSRVGGEGDYIPAIADSFLGMDAERLRAAQDGWKEPLRQLIESSGIEVVVRRLKAAGSRRANPGNVRRWSSRSSIRTDDPTDFNAIMQLIRLEGDASQLWKDMERIDKAHLRAGQHVRTLLNRELLRGDTAELETRGWQDYDVKAIKGEGALRVARVEARAPDTVRISARHTRQLIPVDRDLWQG